MTFLSKSDLAFMSSCITGNGPTVVSETPMVRKQGNGYYTGFVSTTYSDGSVTNSEFIMNARSVADVRASYFTHVGKYNDT